MVEKLEQDRNSTTKSGKERVISESTEQLLILISNWILTQDKLNELLWLWFSTEQILENTIKLKHLTELYDNNKKVEIVSFEKLKNIVNSSKNLEEIKETLKEIIDLERYDLWTQALIISILN